MSDFTEYEIVRSESNLRNVPKDTLGTILIVHDKKKCVYEVEFVDGNYNTIAVLTVFGHDLRKETLPTEN